MFINNQSDFALIESPKFKNGSIKEIFVYISGFKLFTQFLSDPKLVSSFRSMIAFRHVDVKITLANNESLNWNGSQEQMSALRSLIDRGVTGKIGKDETWIGLSDFATRPSYI